MRKSLSAVLLSAFIYPGSGHFFLKKYIQGIVLAGVASVCLYFLLKTVITLALEIRDKILNGEIPVDMIRITEEIWKLLDESGIHQINISTSLFIVCWIIGIFDSYRLGRIADTGNKEIS
jgi:hypothetical protein